MIFPCFRNTGLGSQLKRGGGVPFDDKYLYWVLQNSTRTKATWDAGCSLKKEELGKGK